MRLAIAAKLRDYCSETLSPGRRQSKKGESKKGHSNKRQASFLCRLIPWHDKAAVSNCLRRWQPSARAALAACNPQSWNPAISIQWQPAASAALAAVLAAAAVLPLPAFSQDLTQAEYEDDLEWLRDSVEQRQREFEDAQLNRGQKEIAAREKEAALLRAEMAFKNAIDAGDADAVGDAWSEIHLILMDLKDVRSDHKRAINTYDIAEDKLSENRIWLEQFKNDYEAQSNRFAIRDRIANCAKFRCSPASFLDDERFTVFQPNVLEMIGTHHAYAQGLTGAGIRIGIDDNIVNFTLPEFAGRVSFEGARLTYPAFFGDRWFSEPRRCQREEIAAPECMIVPFLADIPEMETLTVRRIVSDRGWPLEGENWFLYDETLPEGDYGRWLKIPHGTASSHGTTVASVAAGRDFGVAPGATIIPIARDFSYGGQSDQQEAQDNYLAYLKSLPAEERSKIDAELARRVQAGYAQYDIVNRSFGISVFDRASIEAELEGDDRWWGEGLRRILPEMWRASMQTETHPDDRTIVVYAVGNRTEEFGALGARLPHYETHVRGHQLSVMAVDHSGSHANYTNFCGPLPNDWDVERWGRHFCLAAPGTVNSAGSRGKGWIFHETEGTSFAAPVVTGAIALLMEKFRGQLGNTEIVKRLVNTANNTGRYAQLEVYGAGLLDLEAALKPVGRTFTGTASAIEQTAATMFLVPQAFGEMGQKLAAMGIEIASLDSMGAPFWASPEQFMQTLWDPWGTISSFSPWDAACCGFYARQNSVSPRTPLFAAVANSPARKPHLGFTPGTYIGPMSINGVHLLSGYGKVGFEKTPAKGFHWGVLGDSSSWLGGRSAGAFGKRARSLTAWVGRGARLQLGPDWSLNASASLVLGQPLLDSDGMLDVGAHLLSTWDIGLERGLGQAGAWSRLSLSQPLRAEAGKGHFSYLAGLANGQPAYERREFSLAPAARELELAWTIEAPFAGGRGVFEIAHSLNAGHDPGRERSRVGLAYWLTW